MHHEIELSEEMKMADKTFAGDPVQLPTKAYEVVSAAGLFKNGKQYATGETILLTDKTAANFIASGDVKEVTNE